MTIALLCPTRDRPEQCKRMLNSAYATAQDKGGITPYISLTDGYGNRPIIDADTTSMFMRAPDGMPTVHRWNKLAELAISFDKQEHKLFMLAADDIVFTTPCWDKALLDHYNALENKIHVYALRDSRDPDGTPHPIVTREYIEAMGYFLPPIFLHWFVDSWTVDIAKANNCFTHLKDYMLVHDKPSDRGEGDETHNRIRQMGWRERDGWVNDKCKGFFELEKARLSCAFG